MTGGYPRQASFDAHVRCFGVRKIKISEVVNDPAVRLLGNILIEATVSGFHMINGNLHPLGHQSRYATIRVTKDKEGVGAFCAYYTFDLEKYCLLHFRS